MSLRWKALIFVCCVSAAFGTTALIVQRSVVQPGFELAERNEAMDDLSRCVHAIRRDTEHLAVSAADYSAWDATVRFVEDEDPNYVRENFLPETFRNLQVNMILVVRSDGRLLWGEVRDSTGEEQIPFERTRAELCRPDHPLVAHASADASVTGLVMTSSGPMLVGSRPITASDGTGPVHGAVIMGRLLDRAAIDDLSARTCVTLSFSMLGALDAEGREALRALQLPDSAWISDADGDVLRAYTVVRDILDKPALLLRVDTPRTITKRGQAATNVAAATALGSGAAMILVMWFVLSRLVVDRLTRVTQHAVRVGASDDLSARLNMKGRDEVSVLARELDRMVDRLAESRAQMLDIARHAGMAQVATDVLHNVGNVLNSVNVSAGLVSETLRRSEAPTLGLAAQLISEHQADLGTFLTKDSRGREIPAFLAQLAQALSDEQATMKKELDSLSGAIEHIRQVIDMQQVHSRSRPLIEQVDPATLLDQALGLTAESFGRHHITVQKEIEPTGPVPIDRHRVLQILVNLLRNAKEALLESGHERREIRITIARARVADRDGLRFSIADTGVGIAPENLERIFGFGFSTRKDGHGFGLHSAANLAAEMGGSLTAASDGKGKGAVFSLEIPLCPEGVKA